MLLRFTAPDMLNTSLIDVATGECAYDITTNLADSEGKEAPTKDSGPSSRWATSRSSTREPHRSSETSASSSPAFVQQSRPGESDEFIARKTTITDAAGAIVAEIQWKGRRPTISICGEKVGALTDLFGSTSVPFLPKILTIPTRFDTEYIWTATRGSLTLFDYDIEKVRGTFHQNVFRIPTKSKGFKVKSPSYLDTPVSPTSLSPSLTTVERNSPNSAFFPAHVPGLGSNYLEFESHPLAYDVEIILSFLLMEILRRGRFNLTPYTFEKPKLWHFKEAKDLLLGRLRRHSV